MQVAYERVNLADIETSSEEDDYGDLFAKVCIVFWSCVEIINSSHLIILGTETGSWEKSSSEKVVEKERYSQKIRLVFCPKKK